MKNNSRRFRNNKHLLTNNKLYYMSKTFTRRATWWLSWHNLSLTSKAWEHVDASQGKGHKSVVGSIIRSPPSQTKFIIAQIQLLMSYLYKQIISWASVIKTVEKDVSYRTKSYLMRFQYEHSVPFVSYVHIRYEAATVMAHSSLDIEHKTFP